MMFFFKVKLLYIKVLINPLIIMGIKSSALVFLIFVINDWSNFDNLVFDLNYVTGDNSENVNFLSKSNSINDESVDMLQKKNGKEDEWTLFDCFLFFIIIAFGFNVLADDPWHIRKK